ncbi:unnamed protein product [Coffea canephora]|uniref:FAS1 domain-containing protein n=1 Tax=Coffea canephora TaxID=49390 RepID=A0A068UEY8_COFCA|nr:unnamed protein product [Coffea canephora]
MRNQISSALVFIAVVLFQCTDILAQPAAAAPAPPGPTNITKILEKAGQFTTLIRLMRITQISDQINGQLNDTNNGITIFAPADSAFSSLKSGTLNSLTDQQKVQLIQFHIIPSFISATQFQTVSNPVRTQAGDSSARFPLNVTTSGSQVNVSTGVDDATVANTIYTDNQLAVYQVDKVLLPLSLFGAPAPALAPAPTSGEDKKKKSAADTPTSGDDTPSSDASGLRVHGMAVCFGAAIFATVWL